MPRGRQPESEHTLSNAERQARYRARQQARQLPPEVRFRQPLDRRTDRNVGPMRLPTYSHCKRNMPPGSEDLPDNLRANPTGEALEASVDLDLNALTTIVPPRGYGRD